jgi:4-hydroxy-3-methylbut-2-enyl diphosphate reductase
MKFEIAKSVGYCFGVDEAIKKAFEILADKELESSRKYMYGELIHNRGVIEELVEKGMDVAEEIGDIENCSTVLIRAHGISPQIKDELIKKDCTVIDCTCTFVNRIHKIVKTAYNEGKQIILVGDAKHPEILGINGECENTGIVISSEEIAKKIEIEDKPSVIVAQTTFSFIKYTEIVDFLKKKIANLEIFDTICITTEKRQQEASEIASRSDMMIVIGSKESSNTMKLFEICSLNCRKTYLVQKLSDIDEIIGRENISAYKIGIVAGASTPQRNIGEVINKMSENVGLGSQQEQDNLYFSEYVESISQLHRGSTVKGAVIRYDNEYVYVDVHDKSEGRIPIHEFKSDPEFDLAAAVKDHTEVDVFVRSIRNTEQGKEIILSKAKLEFSKNRELVEAAFRDKQPVMVKIINTVKDGVIGTYGGVDIYIHRTQLEMGPVENLDAYKGRDLEILVTQYDATDKRRLRVSGSRRILLNQERKEKADGVWTELEINKVYKGIVRSLTDFGAFVDIGGVDGLVHVSELSWNRIKHPSEVLKPGEEIEVYIKEFDEEKRRISLGYKKANEDPYKDVEENYPIGTVVSGKVVRMFPFGAFIEIAPGVDALCHISQISNVRLVKPADALKEGMEVNAKVLEVNNQTRRISVSIKEVEAIDPVKKADAEPVESTEVAEELPVKEVPVVEAVSAEETVSEVKTDAEAVTAVEEAPEATADVVTEAEAKVDVTPEITAEPVAEVVEAAPEATTETVAEEVEAAPEVAAEPVAEETVNTIEDEVVEAPVEVAAEPVAEETEVAVEPVETVEETKAEETEAEEKTDEEAVEEK